MTVSAISRDQLYSHFYRFGTDDAAGFLKRIAVRNGLEHGIRCLDVGCGPGRLLPVLAGFGWYVVGMEPDEDFYRGAKERFATTDRVTVEQGGFLDLKAENEFDLIVAMKGPFYYLNSLRQRTKAIECIFRALRPGGVAVLDFTNFLNILQNYQAPTETWRTVDGSPIRKVTTHNWDLHDGKLHHKDEYFMEGSCEPFVVDRHAFSIVIPGEVEHLMSEADFVNVETFPSYEAIEPAPCNGSQVIVTGQK